MDAGGLKFVSLVENLKANSHSVPKLLLVDDDLIFGKVMQKIAGQAGIQLTYFSSVKGLEKLSSLNIDIGLVDYDLGSITGLQLARFLENYLSQLPVILISQYKHINLAHWPKSVIGFVPKSNGSYGILSAAIKAFMVSYQPLPTVQSDSQLNLKPDY